MTRPLLLGFAAVLVATCAAAAGPVTAAPRGLVTADLARQAPPPGGPAPAVVDGLTDVGYQLSRRAAAPDGNWVMSPLSIACAFAMARAGAGGETAAQLDRIFHFPPAGTHEAFNALDRQLAPDGGPLRIANALWAQPGLPIGKPFLRTLAEQYGSGVRTVDFRSPGATEAIDAWVREQTNGRIRKLFDRLDPDTKAVLANAIYFKADWRTAFLSTDPGASFTRPDGSTVKAPMMNQVASLAYAEGPGWRAVEVPYKTGDYAMWVLLPEPSGGAPLDLLAPDTLAAVGKGLRPAFVDMTMPKWEFDASFDLLAVMRELGFTAVGDFSGINPHLYLGQAVHRATITVDEEGTEAAAVTGMAMPVSAGPRPEVTFRADRPFAFAIMHTPTRTPAFIGTVTDPTA
ncbi:serpin family protein [Phytohabitans sp. LJ34]|uniref:serpin family protein n=1 Tax=Phytohabitans sp. LJ34 TaxID=3452217 RepID=UPI003F89F845